MANTPSARKKVKQDKKKMQKNKGYAKAVATVMKTMLKRATKSTQKDVEKKGYSAIDKAAKKKVMHKKSAARMKSRLSKTLQSK